MEQTTFYIKLSSIDDMKEFVEITTASMGEFDLISKPFVLDGKSLMGLLSLPKGTPICLVAKDAEKETIKKLRKFENKNDEES